MQKFKPNVTDELKYYVYIYIDPRDEEVFYVGKGKGNRAFAHLNSKGESDKSKRIAEIRKQNLEPRIEILVHGLEDEMAALKVEAAVIDLIGKVQLTNEVRGYESTSVGRMTLEQINAEYDREPVEISEPVMLIRISRYFRHAMSTSELYEVTRKCWKVGPKRDQVEYIMGVYKGIVREVYKPVAWVPCGTVMMPNGETHGPMQERWEFVGKLAEDEVRRKYRYRSVAHYFTEHSQNVIQYVNV